MKKGKGTKYHTVLSICCLICVKSTSIANTDAKVDTKLYKEKIFWFSNNILSVSCKKHRIYKA